MANPVVTSCVQDAWTKVATNTVGCVIWPTNDAPKKYLHTFRLTGDAAPTLRSEGALIDGASVPIPSEVGIDAYVWCVGAAGSVKVDNPFVSVEGTEIAATIAALGMGANAGKLQRVDDDTWEVPVADDEYYAPPAAVSDSASLLAGEPLIRIHFGAEVNAAVIVAGDVEKICNFKIRVNDASGDGAIYTGYGPVTNSAGKIATLAQVDDTVVLTLTGADWTVLNGWVDITKVAV